MQLAFGEGDVSIVCDEGLQKPERRPVETYNRYIKRRDATLRDNGADEARRPSWASLNRLYFVGRQRPLAEVDLRFPWLAQSKSVRERISRERVDYVHDGRLRRLKHGIMWEVIHEEVAEPVAAPVSLSRKRHGGIRVVIEDDGEAAD